MNKHNASLAELLTYFSDNFIQLNVGALSPDELGLCALLSDDDIDDLMSGKTRACGVQNATLSKFTLEITLGDILSGRFMWICLLGGFNTKSIVLLRALFQCNLVKVLKCRTVEMSVMQAVIDIVALRELEELILPPMGLHVGMFLRAMLQCKISVNKLTCTSVPNASTNALCALVSSPRLTVAHLEIKSGSFTRESVRLLDVVAGRTWLRTLTLGPETRVDNIQIYKQIQNKLLIKHQLLAMLQCRLRPCAVSKLPAEVVRMLSTFMG